MGGRGSAGGTLTAAAVESRVVDKVNQLVGERNRHARLATLRESLGLPKDDVDSALIKLAKAHVIRLSPQDDQKQLTAADRAGAIRFGDRINHLVSRY